MPGIIANNKRAAINERSPRALMKRAIGNRPFRGPSPHWASAPESGVSGMLRAQHCTKAITRLPFGEEGSAAEVRTPSCVFQRNHSIKNTLILPVCLSACLPVCLPACLQLVVVVFFNTITSVSNSSGGGGGGKSSDSSMCSCICSSDSSSCSSSSISSCSCSSSSCNEVS